MTRAEILSSGQPANAETIDHLRNLLGRDVVLLPVKYGDKRPSVRGWQNLTTAAMEDRQHLDALLGSNIGVLLGRASSGLVSIDFDDETYGQKFFDANSALAAGLVTKGARGCNFWLRLTGEIPASFNLRNRDGSAIGEFRADGRQTVVYGSHPSGKPYHPVSPVNPPAVMTWDEIHWPDDLELPGTDKFAQLVAEHGEPVLVSRSGAVAINQPFFAAKFLIEHPVIFRTGRGFYKYEPSTGLWERLSDDEVKLMLSQDLWDYGRKAGLPQLAPKRTDSLLCSLAQILRGHAGAGVAAEPRRNVLHFANGMLNLEDEAPTLRPFAHSYHSTSAIPFRYDSTADCPKFIATLQEAVGPADAQLIFDWLGMALTGHNFAQKILLLVGVGGAGKGLLTTIITELIGKLNCEQLRTAQLNTRFELSRFIDKTLLVGSDVPGDFLNLAGAQVLKSLTGHDLLSIESKNKNGSCPILGDFNILVTSNQRLRLRLDGDHGAWRRRLLIVEFDKPVARVNPKLAEEIIRDEAPGIINLALRGLARVRASFGARGAFPMDAKQLQRVEGLIDESDSLRSFLRSSVTTAAGGDVTTEELKRSYSDHCAERGWIEQSAVVFRNQVPQLMHEFFRARARHDIHRDGSARRGYSGVSLRQEDV